jgi:predicted RNase H-like HicB family nuclease
VAKKALGLGIHAGNDRKGETVEEAKEDLKKAVALILEDRLADVKRGLPADAFIEAIAI